MELNNVKLIEKGYVWEFVTKDTSYLYSKYKLNMLVSWMMAFCWNLDKYNVNLASKKKKKHCDSNYRSVSDAFEMSTGQK